MKLITQRGELCSLVTEHSRLIQRRKYLSKSDRSRLGRLIEILTKAFDCLCNTGER